MRELGTVRIPTMQYLFCLLPVLFALVAWAAGAQQRQPKNILDYLTEGLSFPVQQPFGSLQLSRAGCCPYAALPVPPRLGGGGEAPSWQFLLAHRKQGRRCCIRCLLHTPA